MLCYIEKKYGTAVLLREIENFERSEFEPSRVTCIYIFFAKVVKFNINATNMVQYGGMPSVI